MNENYQGEYDSMDSLVFQEIKTSHNIDIKDIFDGQNLNMQKIDELKMRSDVDQRLIQEVLDIQQKINKMKNERDLLIQGQLNQLNNQQPDSKNQRVYTHWTHQESQKFVDALEKVGKNNELITNYLNACGVNKLKQQVISHSQKFFNKLKKIISDDVPTFTPQQLKLSFSGLQSTIDKINNSKMENPNITSENAQKVLSVLFQLIQAALGSVTVAVNQYIETGNPYALTFEQILYIIKNYEKYIV